LCAEGGARKNKHGLHKITLSFNNKEKELFQYVLDEAGISDLTSISQNSRFVISGWENLYNFFKIFLLNNITPFSIHSTRKNNALNGFLEHSFTKTAYKYLKILSTKSELTTRELVTETHYLANSILNTLRRKQYSTFIDFRGRGTNRNPYRISVTQEGKDFINLIKRLTIQQNGRKN
jgi:hypothetical protein